MALGELNQSAILEMVEERSDEEHWKIDSVTSVMLAVQGSRVSYIPLGRCIP